LNPIERVIEKLNQEQIFPVIEEKGFEIIKWPSKRFNDQISINETNIAYQEDRLA
jgi:glutathione peroxidase-family protein